MGVSLSFLLGKYLPAAGQDLYFNSLRNGIEARQVRSLIPAVPAHPYAALIASLGIRNRTRAILAARQRVTWHEV